VCRRPDHPMQTPRPRLLLIVDDDRAILTLVGTIALKEGFDVATAVGGEDALRQLSAHPSDLVLLDLQMPGVTGLDVLRGIADVRHGCRVVVMSGYATIDSAVEAVRRGAGDFFTKPFDIPRLRRLQESVRRDPERRRALLDLEGQMAEHLEFCAMIGRAPIMQDVFTLIRRLAPHARTALVTGEPGTGKELLQAKLLRVIENGKVQRVGSVETRKIEVRLVAAANRDLRAEVESGRVRSDVYYRLNVAQVTLPPLRDRREDIPFLTSALVRAFSQRFGKELNGNGADGPERSHPGDRSRRRRIPVQASASPGTAREGTFPVTGEAPDRCARFGRSSVCDPGSHH
jgi:DNA-binding NtrC family response regulator